MLIALRDDDAVRLRAIVRGVGGNDLVRVRPRFTTGVLGERLLLINFVAFKKKE